MTEAKASGLFGVPPSLITLLSGLRELPFFFLGGVGFALISSSIR